MGGVHDLTRAPSLTLRPQLRSSVSNKLNHDDLEERNWSVDPLPRNDGKTVLQ